MLRDPARLGTVQDVDGATVSIALDVETAAGLTFVGGHPYRVGQIGSFVRVPLGYLEIIGIVTQAGAGAVPERLSSEEPMGYRWLRVELIGEARRGGAFERGVAQLPTIGDAAFLVGEQDLEQIYGRPDSTAFVSLGRVASAEGVSALLDVNRLVTRHSAVVGSTGAGKSTGVASLIASLSDKDRYPSARIIVLDIHGEYVTAFAGRAGVFSVRSEISDEYQSLFVPYWALSFDELLPLTFGQMDDAGRAAVRDEIVRRKRETLERYPVDGLSEEFVTVDSPVPFSIHGLWLHFHRLLNATHTIGPGSPQSRDTEALLLDEGTEEPIEQGDADRVIPPQYRPLQQGQVYTSGSQLNIRRQVDTLASRLRDPRYSFLFDPGPWRPRPDGGTQEDLDTFLQSWLGSGNPVSVLDLSGVPVSITNDVIGILIRLVYDAMFWARGLSEGGRERPVLFVLEEAHTYLRPGSDTAASLAVQRVVKEGRKYGVGAMVVSQRPSEIDETILSQCGTIVAMRLANPTDRSRVVGSAPDNLSGLLSMLPILRTGEALVLGEAVSLPMRVLVDQPAPELRPVSDDPLVIDPAGEVPGGWDRSVEPSDFSDVMYTWRQQHPRSQRLVESTDNEEEE